MSDFYDRDGAPLSLEEWSQTFEDMDKRRVASDTVDGWWVSTVWLGLDHSFLYGPPLIFETMVFVSKNSDGHDYYQERYTTEEQALAGHKKVVAHLKTGKSPEKLHEGRTDD